MTQKFLQEKDDNGFLIFSGNANPKLAQDICNYLGLPLSEATVGTFSDGEIKIEIKTNVRRRRVFIIQPTCAPVNDNLIELILMADATKRSSAKSVMAVMPYFAYARQDKKVEPRVPISAKAVANLLTVAGVNRLITMDLHAGQIQGFFDVPVDNLFAAPLMLEYWRKNDIVGDGVVIVSPDAGGVERARAFAKRMKARLAIVFKHRDEPNKAKAMEVIGNVRGKKAIILDDMVDTAGTLTEAASALKNEGAIEVHACCSHAVLSGPAIQRINDSCLETVVVTDSIPLGDKATACNKFRVLSIAKLVGEAIIRSYRGDSVTSLFV
jgi:ribose-phosphate pyrophosphokinase